MSLLLITVVTAVATPGVVMAAPGVAVSGSGPAIADSGATAVNHNTYNLQWQVDLTAAGGTSDLMPLWQVANRGGRLGERQTDGWLGARIETDWRLPANNRADGVNNPGLFDPLLIQGNDNASIDTPWYTWRPDIRVGAELLGKTYAGESRIYEAFVQLRYGPFQTTAGRKNYTTGFPDDRLSSGSMGMSPNAAPFPRISAGIPEYTLVPLTGGFLEVKGRISHGWLDDNRYTSDPWLHEKFLYTRMGNNRALQVEIGLTHFAMWGGVNPVRGPAPDKFKDFMRLFFARGAGTEYLDTEYEVWVHNAIGDHLGVMEIDFGWHYAGINWDTYHQSFFEDGSGIRFYHNRTNRKGVNLDGLSGLRLRPDEDSFLHKLFSGLVIEHLNTTWQSGPSPDADPTDPDLPHYDPEHPVNDDPDYPYTYGGRDNYYNHSVYRSGWTYRGHAMGPALMLRDTRAGFYYPEAEFEANRFVSNRVRAWHIGLEGRLGGRTEGQIVPGYRLLITRARHQGLYANIDYWNNIIDPDAPFAEKPVQYHFMLELSGSIPGVGNARTSSSRPRTSSSRPRTSSPGSRISSPGSLISSSGSLTSSSRPPSSWPQTISSRGRTLLSRMQWTVAITFDTGELANHAGFLVGLRFGS